MKVVISEVAGPRDAVMASGIAVWMRDLGVTCEGPVAQYVPMPPPVAAAGSVPKPAKPSKKSATVVAQKAGSAPEKRITIRSRILASLSRGPKTVRQVLEELNGQGLNSDMGLMSQHLYLIGRDKLAKRDDETELWSLA